MSWDDVLKLLVLVGGTGLIMVALAAGTFVIFTLIQDWLL